MSTKITIAAFGALAAILAAPAHPSAQEGFGNYASARRSQSAGDAAGYRSHTQVNRSRLQVPSDAYGSIAEPAAIAGTAVSSRRRPFETDPDSSIRFEMNRDDRDRRGN